MPRARAAASAASDGNLEGAAHEAVYMTASSGTSDPASASVRKRPSPWILGSWQDLVLFVGTPALILPAFWITKTQLSIA